MNCSTCALYPCRLWRERPQAYLLAGDAKFDFATLSQMPMPCGGSYWEQRKLTSWEQQRRRGPAGLMQFIKKDGVDK